MKSVSNLLIVCFLIFSSFAVFAQTSQPNNQSKSTERNSQSASAKANYFMPFKAKRTKEQERQLLPNQDDLAKYKAFLEQPKTGIFRLMNDVGCESNVYVIRVDDSCKNSVPNGSFYSFREKEYTTAYLSDLRLIEGILVSDGMLSQNILTELGDVSLENLTLESQGMNFITKFTPETEGGKATEQFIRIVRGIRVGDFEYRKALPAIVNSTYALRIIAYRGSVYRNFRGWFFNLLDGDKRIDSVVAFRIIRKETDGNITILWKELDRKKSPKLKREVKKPQRKVERTDASNRTVAEI